MIFTRELILSGLWRMKDVWLSNDGHEHSEH
jgi:hypothetical protein